jgi:hypothetical protein
VRTVDCGVPLRNALSMLKDAIRRTLLIDWHPLLSSAGKLSTTKCDHCWHKRAIWPTPRGRGRTLLMVCCYCGLREEIIEVFHDRPEGHGPYHPEAKDEDDNPA